jgi:hypothetical protein
MFGHFFDQPLYIHFFVKTSRRKRPLQDQDFSVRPVPYGKSDERGLFARVNIDRNSKLLEYTGNESVLSLVNHIYQPPYEDMTKGTCHLILKNLSATSELTIKV